MGVQEEGGSDTSALSGAAMLELRVGVGTTHTSWRICRHAHAWRRGATHMQALVSLRSATAQRAAGRVAGARSRHAGTAPTAGTAAAEAASSSRRAAAPTSRSNPTSASSSEMVTLASRPSPRRSKVGCGAVRSRTSRSPCSPARGVWHGRALAVLFAAAMARIGHTQMPCTQATPSLSRSGMHCTLH